MLRHEGADRQGLERLLRYCARPAFALERLREIDAEHLIYESVKPGPGGSVTLLLTRLELIKRLAALIPPPRRHRHRYYGMLAPNAPLRAQVRFRRNGCRPNDQVFNSVAVGLRPLCKAFHKRNDVKSSSTPAYGRTSRTKALRGILCSRLSIIDDFA